MGNNRDDTVFTFDLDVDGNSFWNEYRNACVSTEKKEKKFIDEIDIFIEHIKKGGNLFCADILGKDDFWIWLNIKVPRYKIDISQVDSGNEWYSYIGYIDDDGYYDITFIPVETKERLTSYKPEDEKEYLEMLKTREKEKDKKVHNAPSPYWEIDCPKEVAKEMSIDEADKKISEAITKENKDSTDGIAEDLIRSFIQMCAAELHLKSLLDKRESELENGLVDTEGENLEKHLKTIESLMEELVMVADARRNDMRYLYKLYGSLGDKEQWCLVKHYGMAMITALEAFQASDDVEIYELYKAKNKLLIKALARFIGVEITDCSACFSDALKGRFK